MRSIEHLQTRGRGGIGTTCPNDIRVGSVDGATGLQGADISDRQHAAGPGQADAGACPRSFIEGPVGDKAGFASNSIGRCPGSKRSDIRLA